MAPRLSLIVPTDTFSTIAELVRHLAAQTIAGSIELVVVCPAADKLGPLDGTESLHTVTVVEHALLPLGEARAAAVSVAQAPVVAIGETHAFPTETWAETVLRAHEEGWAAVVPTIVNGNPEGGATSWSSLLIDYGRWAPGGAAGEIHDPPAYNATFDRDVLLGFGAQLGLLLEPGSKLAQELAAVDARAYHEPAARLEHLNVAPTFDWLHERFLGGRLLGATRRLRWPMWRTAVYLVGSPLVPVVRFKRTNAARRCVGGSWPSTATLVAVVLGCIIWGIGEAVGYASGGGSADRRMLHYELHKARYR